MVNGVYGYMVNGVHGYMICIWLWSMVYMVIWVVVCMDTWSMVYMVIWLIVYIRVGSWFPAALVSSSCSSGDTTPCSGRDCVKSLRSSYTELFSPQSSGFRAVDFEAVVASDVRGLRDQIFKPH